MSGGSMRAVKVRLGGSPQDAVIEIDGKDVTRFVQAVTVIAESHSLAQVELTAFTESVDLEGDVLVSLRETPRGTSEEP